MLRRSWLLIYNISVVRCTINLCNTSKKNGFKNLREGKREMLLWAFDHNEHTNKWAQKEIKENQNVLCLFFHAQKDVCSEMRNIYFYSCEIQAQRVYKSINSDRGCLVCKKYISQSQNVLSHTQYWGTNIMPYMRFPWVWFMVQNV